MVKPVGLSDSDIRTEGRPALRTRSGSSWHAGGLVWNLEGGCSTNGKGTVELGGLVDSDGAGGGRAVTANWVGSAAASATAVPSCVSQCWSTTGPGACPPGRAGRQVSQCGSGMARTRTSSLISDTVSSKELEDVGKAAWVAASRA